MGWFDTIVSGIKDTAESFASAVGVTSIEHRIENGVSTIAHEVTNAGNTVLHEAKSGWNSLESGAQYSVKEVEQGLQKLYEGAKPVVNELYSDVKGVANFAGSQVNKLTDDVGKVADALPTIAIAAAIGFLAYTAISGGGTPSSYARNRYQMHRTREWIDDLPSSDDSMAITYDSGIEDALQSTRRRKYN